MQTVAAQLLCVPPISGECDEVRYDAIGTCTWVKFSIGDLEEWVGVFGNGDLGHVSVSLSNGLAFVLAGGTGYLVDVPSRRLVLKVVEQSLVDSIAVPNTEYVLTCSWVGFSVYNRTGLVHSSGRVAMDGMRFASATASCVTGFVDVLDGTIPFQIEVGSWRYRAALVYDEEKFLRKQD